ncbi:MAG: glycosyl hydrolase [Bryobacteraceae bacterium]
MDNTPQKPSLDRRTFLETTAGLFAAYPTLLAQGTALSDTTIPDQLNAGFLAPPPSAKPWVFFLWSNHRDRKALTTDLEALQSRGVGGLMLYSGEVDRLSQSWNEDFRFLLAEAARLGLVVNANIATGLNTDGTWVTPDIAAKRLVYSETQVQGPQTADILLPVPLTVDRYYEDVAVVAVREKDSAPVTPSAVTASSTQGGYVGEWNWPSAFVCDRDPESYWRADPTVPPTTDKPAWLDLYFGEMLPAVGLYIAPAPDGGPRECELQASQDGKLQTVLTFTMEIGEAKRLSFPRTTSSRFRLLIHSAHVPDIKVAEAWLLREGDEPYSRHGLKWWPFKSGNRGFWDYPKEGPSVLSDEHPGDDFDVRSGSVIDLAANMKGHGALSWEVPAGRWTVLRFGSTVIPPRSDCELHSPCSQMLDVFNTASADANVATEVRSVVAIAGALAGTTLTSVHLDSYECGVNDHGQLPNWTVDFREQFRKRRGYDILPYLPILAQRIVESREVSNRFLWDFRRSIADLYTAYYARLQQLTHQYNLKSHHENGYGTYPFPHIDGLQAFGQDDVPQGEFWTATPIMSQFFHFCNSVRTAASAAHIYGKQLVQAEAFSTWLPAYQCYPAVMKPFGDEAFCDGLQQCVIFCSSSQTSEVPGANPAGYEIFNRHITWHKQSGAFFDYLSRCEYLLQQGQFAADVVYLNAEGATQFVPSKEFLKPALPAGYDFDAINADVLLNRISAAPGRILLPDGMSYRLLVLPERREMSLPVLRKIKELIEAGATVLGNRPLRSVGLSGQPQSDQRVTALADEIWAPGGTSTGDRRLGKGRVVWGKDPSALLSEMNVSPDFEIREPAQGLKIRFTHRRSEGTDIYFVANLENAERKVQCLFRIVGLQPEILDPLTGRVWDAGDFRHEHGRTVLPLTFAPHQSFFVIFRKAAALPKTRRPNLPAISSSVELTGPWTVHFDPKWGGPASVVFQTLEDWTKRPEDGLKYYSGTATYQKTFQLPQAFGRPGSRLLLDLGEIGDLAEVRLNGKTLGVLWTKPYRIDITEALQGANNLLEIDIVNMWTNRLIGDAALPPTQRFTTGAAMVKKGDRLLPSGLLGPVRLHHAL